MYSTNIKQQSGFTLVEIAIVLVIISLLLGGVLKGTELIENSKVRRSVNDINGVAAAYNAYVDRYRAIPGDDNNVTSRGGDWASVTVTGDANGRLTANRNNTFTGGGEQDAFWIHLKAAGFISGNTIDTGSDAMPRNAFGGFVGVTTQSVNGNLNGLKVCLSQVPGKAALALDGQLDDGETGTGSMRATAGNTNGSPRAPGNGALTAGYDEELEYTVCMRI